MGGECHALLGSKHLSVLQCKRPNTFWRELGRGEGYKVGAEDLGGELVATKACERCKLALYRYWHCSLKWEGIVQDYELGNFSPLQSRSMGNNNRIGRSKTL